jgi:hypothetical protein
MLGRQRPGDELLLLLAGECDREESVIEPSSRSARGRPSKPSVLEATKPGRAVCCLLPRKPAIERDRPPRSSSTIIEHLRLRRPQREQRDTHERLSTDPETGVASGIPEAAICVQDIDVQCVLQFTLIHAAGCALHRHTSRVIHRLELSNVFTFQEKEGGASSYRSRAQRRRRRHQEQQHSDCACCPDPRTD